MKVFLTALGAGVCLHTRSGNQGIGRHGGRDVSKEAKLLGAGVLIGLGVGINLAFAFLLRNPAYLLGALAPIAATPAIWNGLTAPSEEA